MPELLHPALSLSILLAACGITFVAGVIKGALGFAMPMVMISGLSSLMPVELALAGLMLPTLVTNLSQALRQGWPAAWASSKQYWRMLLALVVFLLLSAQALTFLPSAVLLMILGVPIILFALVQLAGMPLRIQVARRRRAEWTSGIIAGLYGGISGVWGPPVMVYLISVDTGKRDMVRVLGIVFLIGAVALVAGHLVSGIANGKSMTFSALLIVPGMLGLWLGYKVQDKLDAARFRRWTLIMMVILGLNLVRQALGA